MSLSRFLDPNTYVRTPQVELQKKANGGTWTQYTATLPGERKLLILLDQHAVPQRDGRVRQNVHVYEMPRILPEELQRKYGLTASEAQAAVLVTKELKAKEHIMQLVRPTDQEADASLKTFINNHFNLTPLGELLRVINRS